MLLRSNRRAGGHDMHVAVIGAGIIGVTTAYELAADGHEVTVFERNASVAAETSFGNAGVIAPGYVTPWAAPGMPEKVLRDLFSRHAAVRLGGVPNLSTLRWMWRWWRACEAGRYHDNRSQMHRLALYSRDRLRTLTEALGLDYDQADGMLVLLRTARDTDLAASGIALLRELGVAFELVDAARCREIEPGLSSQTALHAGIHLARDGVGNCRQFAHLLKTEAVGLGAKFRFHHGVTALAPGPRAQLSHRYVGDGEPHATEVATFDAVVVCAALDSASLLAPVGLRLPLAAVHGYSVTAPLRPLEGEPIPGPRAALMDERYKVAISRLGDRVRVAGGAELGGSLDRMSDRAFATLYKVLQDWFPGAAHLSRARHWKGARPMLPDGPPVLGASGRPGLWLNVGHGSSGWALACGSARVLADTLVGRAPAIDIRDLGVERLR
jgi:D-amino-acid dehydrogenase